MSLELMLDLETLSTNDNAAIVQLACVSFDGTRIFNERIAPSSYNKLLARFSRTQGTMDWWAAQPQETRDYVMGGFLPPATVLELFASWIQQLPEPPIVWANPVTFDITILENAYASFDLEFPLNWRNCRCFRTLSEEFQFAIPRDRSKTTHNAVQDCVDQIERVKAIRTWYNRGMADS